ncbi:MAG TPA: ribosome biogenesis GTP-binding protein YihA/YsxC [Myxococcales bacterium]|nr:ribosome biogenesis GTP-binding protein YihA/YsxC [Myxococcales bacterium]
MIVLDASFVKSATKPDEWPPGDRLEAAFCGRSNVGKSSCLNALVNRRQLARVSRTPGRTRLLNFFDVSVAERTRSGGRGPAHAVRLADLPGYGFASGPREERARWKEMIETYLTRREPLRFLVVLIDGELGAQPSDVEMVRWARSLGKRIVVVATKLDRLARTRRDPQLEKIAARLEVPRDRVIAFSAKEKFGVAELWRELLDVGTRSFVSPISS